MLTPLCRPKAPGAARPLACLLPLDHEEMACDTTSSLSSTSLEVTLLSPSRCGALSCLSRASAAPISLSLSPFFVGALTGSRTPARLPAISGGARSPPLRIRTALATPEAGRDDASTGPCCADLRSIEEAGSEKAGLTLPLTPPASPRSSTPPSTRRGAAEARRVVGQAGAACRAWTRDGQAGPLFSESTKSSAILGTAAASGARCAAASRFVCVVCAPILGSVFQADLGVIARSP
mmetsp:Transcript_29624/g.69214  ORF Transcript_29624/g.69214 Transcript_29624/m.69214 type:complete len:236 (-) Transcript_29624:27-734(-)